jgi:nitrite reductase (NADH) large subunit
VFGAEPHGNYNRIMLSPVLAGDKTLGDIIINDFSWYQEKGIRLFTNTTVIEIDRIDQKVIAQDGTEVAYDRLVLATGSNPIMLSVPGNALEGVISFRHINDVNTMIEVAQSHKKAVVIGGGLLGLEAANGLMQRGMSVTVVQRNDLLMGQQLDKMAADLMQRELEAKGLQFLMSHNTQAFIGSDRVEKVQFDNGTEVEADLVVVATGVRPNISLAEQSGLQCERGILVNDTLQTFTPNIYAVGECVQHRNTTFGLVAPLFEQAKVCANHLAELGIAMYMTKPLATQLKVTGINVFSAGHFEGDADSEILVYKDPARYIYKKLVIKANQLIGVVLYGDTHDGQWYFSLLNSRQNIAPMRKSLVFGQSYCEPEQVA